MKQVVWKGKYSNLCITFSFFFSSFSYFESLDQICKRNFHQTYIFELFHRIKKEEEELEGSGRMIQWNELACRWEMGLVRDEEKISRRKEWRTNLSLNLCSQHLYDTVMLAPLFPLLFPHWLSMRFFFWLREREREREFCQIWYDDDDCQLSFPFLERSTTTLNQHFFTLPWLWLNQSDNWFCNVYKLLRFLSKLLT